MPYIDQYDLPEDWHIPVLPFEAQHAPMANGVVYLSGPITGLTYNEARYGWRKQFSDRMLNGITVLSPMRHEGHLREIPGPLNDKNLPNHFMTKAKVIVEKDLLDIRRSDIIAVNLLDATDVSRGTLVEIGMAYAMGKTILVAIEDAGNPKDSFFVREPAGLVVDNLDDLIHATNSLLSEGL